MTTQHSSGRGGLYDRALAKPVKRQALARLLAELLEPSAPVPLAGDAAPAPFAGRSALLVDDNVVNQKLGQRLLAKLGFAVTQAWDGRQAIACTEVASFDLVLMDCQMPELDGYEATRQLRLAERAAGRPPVPVLAMTANALSGDRERCLAAGMSDYLSKPIDPTRLRVALDALLCRTPAPRAGDAGLVTGTQAGRH